MMSRELEVEKHLRRMEALEAEVVRLRAEVARLKAENDHWKAEHARLEAKNAELHRRLAKGSSNSHKSPGSDGYPQEAVPKIGHAQEAEDASGRHLAAGRPAGEDVGAFSASVCRLRAGDPSRCSPPGDKQTAGDRPAGSHIGSHRAPVGRSNLLRCCQQGAYPSDVTAAAQYGPGVQALVTPLSMARNMPLGQIRPWCADTYGYERNQRPVENILRKGHELAEPVEASIKAQRKQPTWCTSTKPVSEWRAACSGCM